MKRKMLLMIAAAAITCVSTTACDDATDPTEPLVRDTRIHVSLARANWYPGTAPTEAPGSAARLDEADHRAAIWYNVDPKVAPRRRDLDPTLDDRENTRLTALDIELLDDPEVDTWTGMMQGIQGGGDFSNVKALAVWVNDFKPDWEDRGGILHIDIGTLDEDFFEPGLDAFDDEDKDHDGFAAAYDDTGLDGLFDEAEDGVGDDPTGDDFDPTRIDGRYLKINGTEGNLVYDTEDIDRSGFLEREFAFIRFSIPLASPAGIDVRNAYRGYDGWTGDHRNDAWRFYLVDIEDAVVYAPAGSPPDLSDVRHIRVWIEDPPAAFRNDIGEPGRRRIQLTEFMLLP
jgi:hypothetical protein